MSKRKKHQPHSADQDHHSAPVHKERGTLLSVLLILLMLRNVFAALIIYAQREQKDLETAAWMYGALIVLALVDVIAGVAMWYWKKWGFNLYLISTLVGIGVGVAITGSLLVAFHDIVYPAILGYVIRLQNKWRFFD